MHLVKREKEFEEMKREETCKISEKDQDMARRLQALDVDRADLEEAECAFKKVSEENSLATLLCVCCICSIKSLRKRNWVHEKSGCRPLRMNRKSVLNLFKK